MPVSIRRVRVIAAGLATVSLALVVATATGAIPASVLPQAPPGVLDAIPHVNAALSLIAIATILYGWAAIRRGAIHRHRAAMGTAFGLFVLFLVLYLYKVAIEGPTQFPGPAVVDAYIYLPILAIHILLAIVCVPLLYYVLLLGITQPVGALGDTDHPRVGRVAAPLWVTSFVLGVVVYALLYLVY
ncbi:MAG: DUF420 domain-containing protein [Halobacteriaceae archaeon]